MADERTVAFQRDLPEAAPAVPDGEPTNLLPYPPEGEAQTIDEFPSANVKGQKKKKIKFGHDDKHSNATSYVGFIVLACFVLCCCGFLCGLVAFILAVCAHGKIGKDQKTAKRLARASLAVSVIGVIIGILFIVISVAVTFSNLASEHDSDWKCSSSDYRVKDICFKHRVPFVSGGNSTTECYRLMESEGHVINYEDDGRYCYYNCSGGLFSVDGSCFRFKSDVRVCAQLIIGNESYQIGLLCYHNCSTQMHAIDGQCYAHRSSAYSDVNCSLAYGNTSYHDGTFCYYNCSAGLVLVANAGCYRYANKVANLSECENYSRFNFQPPYCYYNCSMGLYSGGGFCFREKRNDANGDFCRTFPGRPVYLDNSICYYNATSPELPYYSVGNSSSSANVSRSSS